jgi:thiamine-phosphate pyrophosphorylase
VGLPRLYPIVDAGLLESRGLGVAEFAGELRDAGVTLLQYRDKAGALQDVLRSAALIRDALAVARRMILNDGPISLCWLGGMGCMLGRRPSPEDVRRVVGEGVGL